MLSLIPYSDENPTYVTPWVTYAIIAINVWVFFVVEPQYGAGFDTFMETYGVIPQSILHGATYQTLLTSMFLHVSLSHILFNMLFLYIFGDNIEQILGKVKYAGFYLICGLVAGLTHVVFNPESTIPAIGASGAISGVLGAYLIAYPTARVNVYLSGAELLTLRQTLAKPGARTSTIPTYMFIGVWILGQIILTLLTYVGIPVGVAVAAHIGGIVCGAVLFMAVRDRRREKMVGRLDNIVKDRQWGYMFDHRNPWDKGGGND